jgi:hypothetical protein
VALPNQKVPMHRVMTIVSFHTCRGDGGSGGDPLVDAVVVVGGGGDNHGVGVL